MKNLLKMEAYELKHDYICMLMIGITFFYGIFSCTGYIDNNYFNLSEGGYEVFIVMLYDSTTFIILISIFVALLMGKSFSDRTIVAKIMSGNSRRDVFFSKTISILSISTISMILVPISGALIVTIRYGWNVSVLESIITLIKIIICTLLLDSVIFSIVIFLGVIFRNTFKIVAASAITIFTNALYMSYARRLNLPMSMHPMRLLRTILEKNSLLEFVSFSLYSIVLLSVILLVSYNIFRRCELK